MPQKNSQPSIQTTETHRRMYKITLDTREIRQILIDHGLRLLGFDQARPAGFSGIDLFIDGPDERCPATGELRPTATITFREELSTPTDFAPPNIEEIVRLNPPATPGLSQGQLAQALEEGRRMLDGVKQPMEDDLPSVVVQAKSRTLKEPTSFEVSSPLNTTAASSRENVDAIERMKRITRLHEVLLYGKGNNVHLSLNRGEVDTLLEILEHSAD